MSRGREVICACVYLRARSLKGNAQRKRNGGDDL